jgi:hypothetical protein
MPLKKFNPHDIVINNLEAWDILVYFFGGDVRIAWGELTYNDISFAQALLVEAIDWSFDLKVNSGNAMPINKPRVGEWRDKIIWLSIMVLTRTAKNWWSFPKDKILARPELYPGVEVTLYNDWRGAWANRVKTGKAVY